MPHDVGDYAHGWRIAYVQAHFILNSGPAAGLCCSYPQTACLQLLEKLTSGAGNVNASGYSPVTVLDALYDAGFLAAFRAERRFGCVHDLFTVGCLCDLHRTLLTGMCRRRGPAFLPGSSGVKRNARLDVECAVPQGAHAEACACTRQFDITRSVGKSMLAMVLGTCHPSPLALPVIDLRVSPEGADIQCPGA